jgi:uncharacterized membrane-anchored protein
MRRRKPGSLFWVVVALQVLGLLGFVGVREVAMRTGREVVLETAPVDPRDVFRGDYVVLRYEISTVSACCFDVGDTVYVSLEPRGDVWQATDVGDTLPTVDAGPYIRGRVTRADRVQGRPSLDVEYGIESYFVPEGTGREIEQARGTLRVVVVVDGWGTAQIKSLLLPERAAASPAWRPT